MDHGTIRIGRGTIGFPSNTGRAPCNAAGCAADTVPFATDTGLLIANTGPAPTSTDFLVTNTSHFLINTDLFRTDLDRFAANTACFPLKPYYFATDLNRLPIRVTGKTFGITNCAGNSGDLMVGRGGLGLLDTIENLFCENRKR